MRYHSSTQPNLTHRSTAPEVAPSLIERVTSLDRPAQLALALFFTLIVLDSYHVIGPSSAGRSSAGYPSSRSSSASSADATRGSNRVRQESFISLERTRSGAIGISSSDTLTRAPMLGRSWLSERYAGRPQRLSAHMILTHTQSSAVPTARALTSRGSAPHHRALSCEALMIHARVVITRGGCVVTPKQLSRLARADDLKSVGDQGPIASVVRSLVNQDNSIALHLLSAPLPFVPVLVGVSTHKSRYDEMILREGLARYGALDDSILISPSAHYAQYGPFIVRKDERTFNQLSAMIGERGGERGEERGEERVGARVLDASDRAWIQQAIHTLTQEPLL